ncbi:MAG TPA: SDR family NAD(P)-dependent oxidoreductase, partial [Candidatus Angelobacter sp.]
MNIQGKGALVTGGASGLGEATVRMLVAQGAKVTILDINDKTGNALAAELGANAQFLKTDVTNAAQVQANVEAAVKQMGGLHFLVTTAGIGIAEKLLGKNGMHDMEKFVRTIQINLIGTFDAIRHAANAMSANQPDEDGGRGVIVTTASVAAYEGQIGQ